MNLSNDAIEIMNISLLTNAYFHKKIYQKKNFLIINQTGLLKNQI